MSEQERTGGTRNRDGSDRVLPVFNTLKKAFRIYCSNFVLYTLLCFFLLIPHYAMKPIGRSLAQEAGITDSWEFMSFAVFTVIGSFIGLFVTAFATGAVLCCLFRSLKIDKPEIRRSLAVAASRCLPVAGTLFLVYLAIATCSFFSPWLYSALPEFWKSLLENSWISRILAFDLFWISLDCLILTPVVAAVPAVVVEKSGVFRAIKRSFQLTKGNRRRVFAILFALFLVYQFGRGLFFNELIPSDGWGRYLLLYDTASYAIFLVFTAIKTITTGLIYLALRTSGGGDIGESKLASVFD
jgi:hypothetical protein